MPAVYKKCYCLVIVGNLWYFCFQLFIHREMEEKKDLDEGLFKSRSYLSCLDKGLKLPTRHILPLLKFSWPSLLACALTAGLCGACFNQFSVAFAQWLAATEPVVLSLPVLTFILLGLLSMGALSFYVGNVVVAISRFAESGSWPVLKFGASRGAILQSSLRAFVFILVGVAVLGLCLAPCALWLGAANAWTMVVFGVLLLALAVPYSMVGLDYLLGEEHDYVRSLSRMKDGYLNWGPLFIVLFCGGLILLVLSVVSWLPAGILAYAGHESMMGVLAGDPTDLPSSVPALIVCFFMLAALITSMFGWLTLFPLSYLYGSVRTRKKEKMAFEEEERRLTGMQ